MKRTYHSDIIVQYKLGILSSEIQEQIPTSTLHNWKNRNINDLFGIENSCEFTDRFELLKTIVNNQKLLHAAKALYYIHSMYTKLFDKVKNKNKILRNSKDLIISTTEKIKPIIGYAKAFKLFSISSQQFFAWKKQVKCKQTPEINCRKLNPNQLTFEETNTIKNYLTLDHSSI